MKRISAATVLAIALLVGCRQKEAVLSGQVFVVTQGRENVKLGDVQVVLQEKPLVQNFLSNKVSKVKLELVRQDQELKVAEHQLSQVTSETTAFLATKPYLANADYLETLSQRDDCIRKIAALRQKSEPMRQRSDELRKIARSVVKERTPEFIYLDYLANSLFVWDSVEIPSHQTPPKEPEAFTSWRNYLATAKKELAEATSDIRLYEAKRASLDMQLSQIAKDETAKQQRKKDAAGMRVKSVRNSMLRYATNLVAIVFQDFPTQTARKTVSDAEGRFTISFPSKKRFSVFIHSERNVFGKNESYYWLVDAPSISTAPIVLSNSRLIENDPDGYLRGTGIKTIKD